MTEKKHVMLCDECPKYSTNWMGCQNKVGCKESGIRAGVCFNKKAEHFAHVLIAQHPVCETMKTEEEE